MKFLRIKAIAKKELIQIWRDPLSLALAFMMPVLLLLIFGYAISLDVDNLTTIVYDADRSSTSRELTDELTASGYFSIVRFADSQREIDTYLDTGRARVAVSIPMDFAKTLRTGGTAQLQIIVDGSDSNTATIALGYLSALTELYSQRIAGERITPLIEPRIRVWYNPDLKSRNFIIPGLIAVIMMVIAALLTSLTFAREWERGTMEQLISTPVKRQELILGKLIPYFLIGFIDMVLTVIMAVFLFDVPLRGNVFILGIVSGVFLFGALGLGIVIFYRGKVSTRSKPDIDGRDVSPVVSSIGIHVRDIKYAGSAPDNFPHYSCTLFYHRFERDLPQGQSAQDFGDRCHFPFDLRCSCLCRCK